MSRSSLTQLAALIHVQREALLSRWREQVRQQLPSAQGLDVPTLNDHVPALLDELAAAFLTVSDETIPEALLKGSPPDHGIQRFKDGFNIVEVVAEYNILRGCLYDLAEESGIGLRGEAFHILNRVLDEAVGLAVQTFATQQAVEVTKRREEHLAFVAHDLRTPLGAIGLAVRMLEVELAGQGDASQSKFRHLLTLLQRNVRNLETLVERILKENDAIQTDGADRLERRELDLWPLVEGLVFDLLPTAQTAGTGLVNQVPIELTVYADASLLKRVLQNLVANAMQYTPRGEIQIGGRARGPGGNVECWVIDDGAGIPEERLPLVFDKHETDPEMEGGTGLGLAIVKSFVEAHGGWVEVESKLGVGSTFRFVLPGRNGAGG